MTWESSDGPACGACGAEGVVLFFIPGGWRFSSDEEGSGKVGICQGCGSTNEQYAERFRKHFGEIRYISDGDVSESTEVA